MKEQSIAALNYSSHMTLIVGYIGLNVLSQALPLLRRSNEKICSKVEILVYKSTARCVDIQNICNKSNSLVGV